MSGIYIPGMEMPTSCFYCPLRLKVDPDTFVCLATNEHIEETFAGTIEMRNRGDCPILPVPDHGRLVDFDAAIKNGWTITRIITSTPTDVYTSLPLYSQALPTVIPADGRESGG